MKKYQHVRWVPRQAAPTGSYVHPGIIVNLINMDKHIAEEKIDKVPEWRLFLARQIFRNRISTALCEAIAKSGMSLDDVGAVIGKSGKEIAWFLRPESLDVDAVADVCHVLGVDPVIIISEYGGLPCITADKPR